MFLPMRRCVPSSREPRNHLASAEPVKTLGVSQHFRAFQCVLFKQKYKHKRLQLLIRQIYSWDYLINMNRLNNINILSSYVEVKLNKFYLVLDTADILNEQISLHVTLRFNLERRTSWLALDPSILSRPGGVIYQRIRTDRQWFRRRVS